MICNAYTLACDTSAVKWLAVVTPCRRWRLWDTCWDWWPLFTAFVKNGYRTWVTCS